MAKVSVKTQIDLMTYLKIVRALEAGCGIGEIAVSVGVKRRDVLDARRLYKAYLVSKEGVGEPEVWVNKQINE